MGLGPRRKMPDCVLDVDGLEKVRGNIDCEELLRRGLYRRGES